MIIRSGEIHHFAGPYNYDEKIRSVIKEFRQNQKLMHSLNEFFKKDEMHKHCNIVEIDEIISGNKISIYFKIRIPRDVLINVHNIDLSKLNYNTLSLILSGSDTTEKLEGAPKEEKLKEETKKEQPKKELPTEDLFHTPPKDEEEFLKAIKNTPQWFKIYVNKEILTYKFEDGKFKATLAKNARKHDKKEVASILRMIFKENFELD